MKNIYYSRQIKNIDQLAAEHLKISSFKLMQIAGEAIYGYLSRYKKILVVTGAGNNAGDGFVIALLALKQGLDVTVWSLIDIESLPVDAKQASEFYLQAGGKIVKQAPTGNFECIVDAIFGTGLSRDITGHLANAINWINQRDETVVAVDIPSGLDADTGIIRGCCVNASFTVTIICYKAGLLTNNGKQQCGILFCEELNVPNNVYESICSQIKLLDESVLKHQLLQHKHNSHKGSFGQVLIAGGHDGMFGALILAGRSALRSGCGIVEVASNCEQVVMVSIQCPELITASNIKVSRFAKTASVIAIGPGLGLNQQSIQVLKYSIAQNKPMVIDADALTLIAHKYQFEHETVLTPHPKEAACLLDTDVATIQSDRIKAACDISQKYQACVILKGSGTIVCDVQGNVFICPFGYSGMATAGMGDVLTGIVASLMAQGFDAIDAAKTAVVWHAIAAEKCNKNNGLIATDVIEKLTETIS